MEKFQKIYQFSLMTDDTNVDELLMMWKTVSEVNSPVEICGKSTVFALFSPEFST